MRRKLNINRVCYAISITVIIIMTALYIAAHAILRETSYESKIEKVNIGFYLNGIEFTDDAKEEITNGNIDINDIYIIFAKNRKGSIYFVGIEGTDKIKVTESRDRGSQKWVIGLK